LIKISLPTSDQQFYVKIIDFLVGPFSVSGKSTKEEISYRSNLDSLSQGGTLFHENDVDHVQYVGELTFIPAISDITYLPTSKWPTNLDFACLDGTTKITENCPAGLASNGQISTWYNYGTDFVYAVESASLDSFIVYQCGFTPTKSIGSVTSAGITRHEYRLKSISALTAYFDYQLTDATFKPSTYITSWDELRTVAKLKEIFIRAGGSVEFRPSSVANPRMRKAQSALSFSVSDARKELDAKFVSKLAANYYPLPEKHFGELAQEAVEKLNAISTNMIAFLKDLRHPRDLIPRLKNLSKLKTHAGNYLSATYGVLPTVSDLQEIMGAFQRVAPYIDRNGFKTYTSVHQDSKEDGTMSYSLEQRIKIAIEDEDTDFGRLSNEIREHGFALTLENVWDLIPYSFILDWFVNVGDFLERIDTRLRMLQLKIRYATMSRKERTLMKVEPTKLLPIVGTLEQVRYSRWTSDQCPVPPLFFRNQNTVSKHYLEASALLLQRTK